VRYRMPFIPEPIPDFARRLVVMPIRDWPDLSRVTVDALLAALVVDERRQAHALLSAELLRRWQATIRAIRRSVV